MSRPIVHLICTSRLVPAGDWRWQEGAGHVLATFRTASEMLRENPRLLFTQGEAAHYAVVEELDPPLFREIQNLAREGRWLFSGGWYLEPDTRLVGLESLVRNLILARRYFGNRFKAHPRVACALETQGVQSGLPQALRSLGYELLLSRDASVQDAAVAGQWVRWLGADDTEIAGLALAPQLVSTDSRGLLARLQLAIASARATNLAIPVFWGLNDPEGGGARDDLRLLERFMAQEKTVEVAHSSLENWLEVARDSRRGAAVRTDDGLALWPSAGVALARLRRQSVRCGALLRQAETLAAAAWTMRDAPFPREELDAAWKIHLELTAARASAGRLMASAEADATAASGRVADVARRICLGSAAALQRGVAWRVPLPLTVLSSSSHASRLPVEAECELDYRVREGGEWHVRVFTPDGSEIPCQEEQAESTDGLAGGLMGCRRKVVFSADLSAAGAAYFKVEACPGSRRLWPAPAALVHVVDPARGLLTSLAAGDGVECLAGALLEPIVLAETGAVVGRFKLADGPRLLVKGPIRSVTESSLVFGTSRIVAQIISYAGWRILEIKLRVEWNEAGRRLALACKSAFPSLGVTCELPGAIGKPPGDGRDRGCGRWLALTGRKDDAAVAVGIAGAIPQVVSWSEQEVRLTVLETRAMKATDLGLHELQFAVTAGDMKAVLSQLPSLADWLESPPLVYAHLPVRMLPNQSGVELLSLEPASVQLTACKRSWDDMALILRLAELLGEPTEAILRLRSPAVEERVVLGAFEIKTLRLEKNGACREVNWADEA